jgi:hypothetical protein
MNVQVFSVGQSGSGGPRAVKLIIPFSGYFIDFSNIQYLNLFSDVKCLFVDNSEGSGNFSIFVGGTDNADVNNAQDQLILVPSFTQGYYPVTTANPVRFFLANGNPNSFVCTLFVLNFSYSSCVWRGR